MSNGNVANYSTTSFINYIFPDTGLYEVRLIANNDTATKTISIESSYFTNEMHLVVVLIQLY